MTQDVKTPRFLKPRIMLIDVEGTAITQLRDLGFNMQGGTFGMPYRCPSTSDFVRIQLNGKLLHHSEQEIVVVNLRPRGLGTTWELTAAQEIAPGYYTPGILGVIDPRPVLMSQVEDDFTRIIHAGGAAVVFAMPRHAWDITTGNRPYRGARVQTQEAYQLDNWSFLQIPQETLHFNVQEGTEVSLEESSGWESLDSFLKDLTKKCTYLTTIEEQYSPPLGHPFQFRPLLRNKYGECVGGIISSDSNPGVALILPHPEEVGDAVVTLIRTVLPEICPHLFPDTATDRWTHSVEYEHPEVIAFQMQKEQVKRQYLKQVQVLDSEIESVRQTHGFLHGILTGTDEELVESVKLTLNEIGFQRIVLPKEEQSANKQEDLQVFDRSPTVLMEIKGISGLPTEGDVHQVNKYVNRRMREWNRIDVRGVFLVNHNRNLPPLQRSNENVFTPAQLQDASSTDFGLMTTWDLFRLVRGMRRWKWPKQCVQDVFYFTGRIPNVPSHYSLTGTIGHFYDNVGVVSLTVEAGKIEVGDKVGYLLNSEFFEEEIVELQVDRQKVIKAEVGTKVGYKTQLPAVVAKNGLPIYRIEAR